MGPDTENIGRVDTSEPHDEVGVVCERSVMWCEENLVSPQQGIVDKRDNHYAIDVSDAMEVDIYEICNRFKVNDPSGCVQHAIKKLLVAGKRNGGKTQLQDYQEVVRTMKRKIDLLEKATITTKGDPLG
jgi:hypothetical protein